MDNRVLPIKGSWFAFGIVMVLIFQIGCSSKSKEIRETQMALERMKEEEKQVMLKASQNQDRPSPSRKIVDGIAARVNDDIILLSEVKRIARLLAAQFASNQKASPLSPAKKKEIAIKALESLIVNKLLVQRAEKSGVVVSDKDLKEYLEKIRRTRKLSKMDLSIELAKQGLTYEKYLENLRSEIKRAKLIQKEITSRVQVSDQECLDYYNKHISDYSTEEEVRIQQILIFLNTPSSAREVAEKSNFLNGLRERIMAGEDFGLLAKRYSQGPNAENSGDAGFFRGGELLPAIEKIAFKMQVGEVSSVTQTKVGLHLIRILERKERKTTPFSEVKDKIKETFMEKVFQERFNAWIEDLKKDAFIEIRKLGPGLDL